MKKIFCLLSLLFLAFSCFAENIVISSFSVEGENIVDKQLSEFPITVTCDVKGKINNGISLVGEFKTSKDIDTDLGILLYKNLMSCKVYVNGTSYSTITDLNNEPLHTVTLIFKRYVINASETENELHRKFHAKRVNKEKKKEFFNLTINDLRHIYKEYEEDIVFYNEYPFANEFRKTFGNKIRVSI